jgi:hypothetical protein
MKNQNQTKNSPSSPKNNNNKKERNMKRCHNKRNTNYTRMIHPYCGILFNKRKK